MIGHPDLYIKRNNTETLTITIGNVTFKVSSDDLDTVYVTTSGDGEIDIENGNIPALAEVGKEISRFVTDVETKDN